MIKIGSNISKFSAYSCKPADKKELVMIIRDRISKEGPNCDLNDIDTSFITDMTGLFYGSDFNCDISEWNVSNVENMSKMFEGSNFNQDISNWKINKNCLTFNMFNGCSIKEKHKPKVLQRCSR